MEFKRLAEVTAAEEATDAANVLVEEDGEIKRVPKTAVGGSGSAIPVFMETEAGYVCSMTFDELISQYHGVEAAFHNAVFITKYPDNGWFGNFGLDGLEFMYGAELLYGAIALDSAREPVAFGDATDTYALVFVFNEAFFYFLSDGTITAEVPNFPDYVSPSRPE